MFRVGGRVGAKLGVSRTDFAEKVGFFIYLKTKAHHLGF
jgi:hypothetical protein